MKGPRCQGKLGDVPRAVAEFAGIILGQCVQPAAYVVVRSDPRRHETPRQSYLSCAYHLPQLIADAGDGAPCNVSPLLHV